MGKIYLKDEERFYALNEQDILYIQIVDRKIVIQCKDFHFYIRLPLSEIEKSLNDNFLRTHKSCIVNLYNVTFYDSKRKKAILSDGTTINLISDKNSKMISNYFNDKLKI